MMLVFSFEVNDLHQKVSIVAYGAHHFHHYLSYALQKNMFKIHMAKISRIELHVKKFNGVAPSQAFVGCGSCGNIDNLCPLIKAHNSL